MIIYSFSRPGSFWVRVSDKIESVEKAALNKQESRVLTWSMGAQLKGH